MILSDSTLKKLITSKELVITPFSESAIQAASIDCKIGKHFLTIDSEAQPKLCFNEPIQYVEVIQEKITIPPHSFLLATTIEYLELPSYITAFVEGRSSIGRMGLFIQNAGWVDSGFKGKITLELYNANSLPIEIQAGYYVCQLVFCKLDMASKKPYNGKYQHQSEATGSRIYQDHFL